MSTKKLTDDEGDALVEELNACCERHCVTAAHIVRDGGQLVFLGDNGIAEAVMTRLGAKRIAVPPRPPTWRDTIQDGGQLPDEPMGEDDGRHHPS